MNANSNRFFQCSLMGILSIGILAQQSLSSDSVDTLPHLTKEPLHSPSFFWRDEFLNLFPSKLGQSCGKRVFYGVALWLQRPISGLQRHYAPSVTNLLRCW